MDTPTQEPEYVEMLILEPIPPDTVSTVRAGALEAARAALEASDQKLLVERGEISFEAERTFPTDQVVVIVVTMMSAMALKAFEEIVLPDLKKKYKLWRKRRAQAARQMKGR